MEKVRKFLTFTGRVQGVGFRYTAEYLAQSIGLTGWVRNEGRKCCHGSAGDGRAD